MTDQGFKRHAAQGPSKSSVPPSGPQAYDPDVYSTADLPPNTPVRAFTPEEIEELMAKSPHKCWMPPGGPRGYTPDVYSTARLPPNTPVKAFTPEEIEELMANSPHKSWVPPPRVYAPDAYSTAGAPLESAMSNLTVEELDDDTVAITRSDSKTCHTPKPDMGSTGAIAPEPSAVPPPVRDHCTQVPATMETMLVAMMEKGVGEIVARAQDYQRRHAERVKTDLDGFASKLNVINNLVNENTSRLHALGVQMDALERLESMNSDVENRLDAMEAGLQKAHEHVDRAHQANVAWRKRFQQGLVRSLERLESIGANRDRTGHGTMEQSERHVDELGHSSLEDAGDETPTIRD